MKKPAIGALVAAGFIAVSLSIPAAASAATTVETVTPGDVGTAEWHTADTRTDGTLDFSTEYGGALGSGAAVLDTPTNPAKVQLFTDAHDGTYLKNITAISYSTYKVQESGVALPALNIRLDREGDGVVDSWLVYEPYQDRGNAAVKHLEWQHWDAWQNGQAKWWSNQFDGPACRQSSPCTIATLLSLFPEAKIGPDPVFGGSFGINQGSFNAGTLGAADALHIATSTGVDVTYDFEPTIALSSKEECKNGGWTTSNAPVFKNQGQCVSSFAKTAGKNSKH